mgnify:CR=1 FL=1
MNANAYIDPEVLYYQQTQAASKRREQIEKQKQKEVSKKVEAKNKKIEEIKLIKDRKIKDCDESRVSIGRLGNRTPNNVNDQTPIRGARASAHKS